MPKIDIYGIHEDDFLCFSCKEAKRICKEVGLEYNFIRVLSKGPDGMPKYDLEVIDSLVVRAKLPSRRIVYPIIFIDNHIARVHTLREVLVNLGYDAAL